VVTIATNIVEIKKVNKYYGDNHVVKDLDLCVNEGEFLTMLGPSGCGKTTTLRMIAGFEEPSDGDIFVEGESVQNREPYERNVNTVFQSYALFPHMTVAANIGFGLKMKGVGKQETKQRVEDMLALVQLSGYEKRMPAQLSGGQKQRVAIARALINNPRVLLLDEPLGALDMKLRKQMQVELKRLQKKLGISFIYVTHDQEEAMMMSDRIAIINAGALEQVGKPDEIYEHPRSRFVADFIGESNILEAYVTNAANNTLMLTMECGQAIGRGANFFDGELVYVSIRPEKAQLSETRIQGFAMPGVVKEYTYMGQIIKAVAELESGQEFKVNRLAGQYLPPIGTPVYISWNAEDAVVMHAKETGMYQEIGNTDLEMLV
jgi:spermidine/putrescine transport system ATP-binding protein